VSHVPSLSASVAPSRGRLIVLSPRALPDRQWWHEQVHVSVSCRTDFAFVSKMMIEAI